jgi:hypothetical protein
VTLARRIRALLAPRRPVVNGAAQERAARNTLAGHKGHVTVQPSRPPISEPNRRIDP